MRMGNDGTVQAFPVPGYRDIQAGNEAAITGARESASAPYTLVDVPDGQGGTRKMPLDMAASALREGPVESQAPMAGGQAGAVAWVIGRLKRRSRQENRCRECSNKQMP